MFIVHMQPKFRQSLQTLTENTAVGREPEKVSSETNPGPVSLKEGSSWSVIKPQAPHNRMANW